MSFIISPSSTAKSDVFTSSGTWSKPSGITFVQVQLWGAGGGAGSGAIGTSSNAGGGGGGGGSSIYTFPASTVPSSVTVTIGAGGSGGAAQTSGSGAAGSAGGNTTFGSLLTGIGGSGASVTTYNPGGKGGGDGLVSVNVGYGNAGGSQDGLATYSAEYGGGSGGNGNQGGGNFGSSGGNSVFGGCGGSGGQPISGSSACVAYPGGISTDTLTAANLTGAACGNETSVAGTAGATQRAIVPIGGGGGGGAAGVPSYAGIDNNYLANGRIFVQTLVGLIHSADGITWTYLNLLPNSCVGICYFGGLYYAAMSSTEIFTSPDLTTFTSIGFASTVSGSNLTGIATDGTTLVISGSLTGNRYDGFYSSTNGTTWTTRVTAGTGGNQIGSAVRFKNGYFFGYVPGATNQGGMTYYRYSANGTTWSSFETSGLPTAIVRSIAYSGTATDIGVYINGLTSSGNGIGYGAVGSISTQALNGTALNAVAFGGGVFVAVGNAGIIYSSTNGSTWTSRTSGTASNLNNVMYTGSTFVVVTGSGALASYTSTNGTTWTLATTLAAASFNAGAGGDGGLCSGGGGGGAALTTKNSGAGGAGGAGYARILSW